MTAFMQFQQKMREKVLALWPDYLPPHLAEISGVKPFPPIKTRGPAPLNPKVPEACPCL